MAKACNYTLTLWMRLTRFLEYPELKHLTAYLLKRKSRKRNESAVNRFRWPASNWKDHFGSQTG